MSEASSQSFRPLAYDFEHRSLALREYLVSTAEEPVGEVENLHLVVVH
jgi:hypothetical protein